MKIALQAFAEGDATLTIFHLTFFDQAAHSLAVHPELYRLATSELNDLIKLVMGQPWSYPPAASTLYGDRKSDRSLVILGDHGHDLEGRHLPGLIVPTAFVTVPKSSALAEVEGVMPMHGVKVALQSLLGYAKPPVVWPDSGATFALPISRLLPLIFVAIWQFLALFIASLGMYSSAFLRLPANPPSRYHRWQWQTTKGGCPEWLILSWLPLLLLILLPSTYSSFVAMATLGLGLTCYFISIAKMSLRRSLLTIITLTLPTLLLLVSPQSLPVREFLAYTPPLVFIMLVVQGVFCRSRRRHFSYWGATLGSLLFCSLTFHHLGFASFRPAFTLLLPSSRWSDYVWFFSSILALFTLILSPGWMDNRKSSSPKLLPYCNRIGMLAVGFLALESTTVPLLSKLQIVTLVATVRLAFSGLDGKTQTNAKLWMALQLGLLVATFVNLGWLIFDWSMTSVEWTFLYRLFGPSTVEHNIVVMVPMILGRYILIIGAFSYFVWEPLQPESRRYLKSMLLPIVLLSIASLILMVSLVNLRSVESYQVYRENIDVLLLWMVLMVGYGIFN